MVAVSHRDADNFIQDSLKNFSLFLIFGTDAGLISERTAAILKSAGLNPHNPDQIIKMDGDDISGNPGKLFEEAHAIGLFAEKRAIILRAGGKQIVTPLEALLETPASDCKILVLAGALRKDAPLRTLATRAKDAAAIECYPDQARDVERLIDIAMKQANLTIEPAARSTLASLLGDDRLSTRAELEKLVLYAHGSGRVTVTDVVNAVADASAFAMDNIIFAAFSGDLSFLGDSASFVYANNNEVHALMAGVNRHCQLLNQIRIDVETGSSIENGIDRGAGRTAFGVRKAALVEQAKHWNRQALAQCIEELTSAILETRRDTALANAIAMQSLLMVARRYRGLRNAAR